LLSPKRSHSVRFLILTKGRLVGLLPRSTDVRRHLLWRRAPSGTGGDLVPRVDELLDATRFSFFDVAANRRRGIVAPSRCPLVVSCRSCRRTSLASAFIDSRRLRTCLWFLKSLPFSVTCNAVSETMIECPACLLVVVHNGQESGAGALGCAFRGYSFSSSSAQPS